MLSAIDQVQQILTRRRATSELRQLLQQLHRPRGETDEADEETQMQRIHMALYRGADVLTTCKHYRAGTEMSALSMAIGHPQVAQALLDHGARFDLSIVKAFRHLVTPRAHDLPMFSRTQRSLSLKILQSARLILESGPVAGIDRDAFLMALDEQCVDKTTSSTRGHPVRRLGDILDQRIPGFTSAWQAMSLEKAQDDIPQAKDTGRRPRL